MNAEKLWTTVLKRVKQTISDPSYQTWFQATKAIELENNQLTIEASNNFQRDWLVGRYYDMLTEFVNDAANSGEPIKIDIVAEDRIGIGDINHGKSYHISNHELLCKINELTERVRKLEEGTPPFKNETSH